MALVYFRLQATRALQGVVFDHSVASLRAFSITRLTAACTRCWSYLDRRAFVNGAFDQGADAQRFKQVRSRAMLCFGVLCITTRYRFPGGE